MVFGNMGETSATGVAFTRNPSTGEKKLYGEFLINAQGEDVVAGIRTPQEISEAARQEAGSDKPSMERAIPNAFAELKRIYNVLERHYRDMQDLEFTVEQGKLWMLQTRTGKRTAKAALRIAVELANEGLITKNEAVMRVDPLALDQLLHPTIDPRAHRKVIATGLPASPGAASGAIVFTPDEAEKLQVRGQESHPHPRRDFARGYPRHARRRRHSDDARRHDLACRGRCSRHGQALRVRRRLIADRLRRADHERRRADLKEGDFITVDGSTGQVLAGRVDMIEPQLSDDFATLIEAGRTRCAGLKRARQCRHAERRQDRGASSAPKASGFAVPSTCSSTRTASRRCAK